MKLKIFVTPALIIGIIVLIIWFVYPAYSNEIDGGIKGKKKEVAKKMELMNGLSERMATASRLAADLSMTSQDNALVFNYIPQKKEEEKIIENLNSLIIGSALTVLNISVVESKDNAKIATTPEEDLTGAKKISNADVAKTEVQAPVTPKAVPRKLEVSLSVVGEYTNIKILLEKVQKLKRFNKVSTMEITTMKNDDDTVSSSLQAEAVFEFNYLQEPKRLLEGDAVNPIFTSQGFDKSVASEIRSSRNIDLNNVLPGQKRGNNPFILAK